MVWGHGLMPPGETDVFSRKSEAYALQNAWPSRLAAKLGWDFESDGLPGGSNDRIVRKTIDRLSRADKPKPSLVIIGWTEPLRREIYYTRDSDYSLSRERWYPLHPFVKGDEWVEDWKRIAWNDYEAYTRYFNSIILLSSYLRQLGIPYLFYNSIAVITDWEDRNKKSEDFVKTEHLFDAINWGDFICYNGSYGSVQDRHMAKEDRLPCGHPTERGHDRWADYLQKELILRNLIPSKA